MDERIFSVILAAIPVVGAIVTAYLVPYLKNKIGAENLNNITFWIEKAVAAAELLFDAPKSGEQKKAYVIDFINKMFNSKKTVITTEQIEVILEASVKALTGK